MREPVVAGPPTPRSPRGIRRDLWLGGVFALVAPLIALREMVASGFSSMPGNVNDGRLVPLFLEHSWLWLVRHPLHRELWSLPFFHPAGSNALAFSDAMLSFGPLYWPWRAAGLAPDSSYQLWLLGTLAASAAAAYAFLRSLGLSPTAALTGGWLAVFSASRLHQISHPQLMPLFFVFAALTGACRYAREERAGRRMLAAAVVVLSLVAQLYGGFYQGLFTAFALAAALLVSLLGRDDRRRLGSRLAADWSRLVALLAAGGVLLAPWIAHYRAAHELVGARPWEGIARWVPVPLSWLYPSPRALAYGWVAKADPFRDLADRFEHAVGLGWFTTAALLAAVALAGRDRRVQVTAGAALLLMLLSTRLPAIGSPWRVVVDVLPPLAAARVVVRIGLLLPVAAGIVLGCALDGLRDRHRAWGLAIVLIACGEQLAVPESHDKQVQRAWVEELGSRVDPAAEAFLARRSGRRPAALLLNVDAMWVATLRGVPTVNGHSGLLPPGWEGVVEGDAPGRARLAEWLARHGLRAERVQVIEVTPSHRGRGRARLPPQERSPGSAREPP